MERFFTKPEQILELGGGPLERYLKLFATALHDDGYSLSTGRFQLQVFGDFSRWLQANSVASEQVTRSHKATYIKYRDQLTLGKRADAEAALNRILDFLKGLEIIPPEPQKPLTELEKLAEEYADYLQRQRGLAKGTVVAYRRTALRFLEFLADGDKFDSSTLNGPNILGFAQQQASSDRKSKSGDVLKALRSFLRFAHHKGYANTELADFVPRVANWSLSTIPKSVSPAQVEKVLSNCDRTTAYGKRDYAILLLLARLGLRVGEVVSLSLDDISWETGTLIVRGKSGPRTMPLPKDVGEAVAQYLSEVRPPTKSRVVFFRLRPPIRAMKSQESICGVVRRAMMQARIESNNRGAHQFRHGLATELLRKGASIPEIGEILGHQKMESTMIYAKVDLKSLQKLAKRWPGGAL